MPSPFPGMNPYLEQDDAWHDFHERFIPAIADALGALVDPRYIVKIDEHLYIHELPATHRRFIGRGDVAVTESGVPVAPSATGVLAPPVRVGLPAVDVERHSFIEIRDRRHRQLVTVLEVLSPTNKHPGPDRDQYVAKRGQLLASPVHFVEFDFLRGGPRMPATGLPECDYYILVSRAEERPDAGMWPVRLRDVLPTIPIPLRASDEYALLNVQNVLHQVYDAARYKTYIYEGLPDPPLRPDDATWADEIVRQGS
jgi:hypothetical protein